MGGNFSFYKKLQNELKIMDLGPNYINDLSYLEFKNKNDICEQENFLEYFYKDVNNDRQKFIKLFFTYKYYNEKNKKYYANNLIKKVNKKFKFTKLFKLNRNNLYNTVDKDVNELMNCELIKQYINFLKLFGIKYKFFENIKVNPI